MPDEPQLVTITLLAKVISAYLVAVGAAAWAYRRLAGRPLWTEEPRPVVPWGVESVVGVAVFYYVLLVLMAALPHPMLAVALANVAIAILTPALLRVTSGARLVDLGLTRHDFGRNLLRGAAGCALVLPVVYVVHYGAVNIWTAQNHPAQEAIAARGSVATTMISLFGAVVAAPLAEEILFRGVLLGALWKRRSPNADLMGNAAVSLLFAALHAAQWPAPIPLFVLSLAFGEVYRRSGSLVAPITMHVCFNAVTAAALLIAKAAGTAIAPV